MSPMALPTTQAFALILASSVLWYILRPFFTRSALANIPGPPKDSWWKGNFHQVFNSLHGWEFHHDILKKYGGVVKLNMLFGDKQLYVSDPLALHHIIIKDQYVYEETDMFTTSNSIVFGTSLFSTRGDHHKKQRKMLNPVFSLKHIRGLLPIFQPIAHELRDVLFREVQSGKTEINILKWISRAALECIGQGGLGHAFNALDDSKTDTYADAIKLLGPTSFKLFLPRQLLPWVAHIGTPAFRRKIIESIPSDMVGTISKIVDTMDTNAQDILKKKKAAVQVGDDTTFDNDRDGKDIMSVLLKANLEAKEEDRLPESELLGQVNTLIFAGHDTTAGALCRILHQLALNVDVQAKLRQEITASHKEYDEFDYESLFSLPYLDAVCRETLRLFPPVPQLNRTTMKDTVLPLAWPVKSVDGKTLITEIPLKKNTNVIISVLGANIRKEIWGEDAEEWKPERWLKPLPESVSAAHLPGVYGSMMSFLGGGRACIGFKFAEMEIKLILVTLLETFAFAPGPEIFWAMNFLQAPIIKDSGSLSPQLPLRVSFVQK